MSRYLRTLTVIVISLIAIVCFQNCRIEILATPVDPQPPTPAGIKLSSIEYHYSGGYTIRPEFTHLVMKVNSNNMVTAELRTESCSTQSALSLNDYIRIQDLIQNSPRRYLNPQHFVADNPTSLVKTFAQSGPVTLAEILYLSEMGVTGWYLEDAAKIEQALKVVVEGLKKLGCSEPTLPISTSSVNYRRQTVFTGATGPGPIPRQAVDIDLTVKFSGNSATLTGFISTTPILSEKPNCRTEFNERALILYYSLGVPDPIAPQPNPAYNMGPDLRIAADKLKYVSSGPICAIAAVVGPIYDKIPATLTSGYLDGTFRSGSIGCQFDRRVENYLAFLQQLEAFLITADTCAQDPLGIRGQSRESQVQPTAGAPQTAQ